MNEGFANEMALKLKQINLLEDERAFSRKYMEIPLPPPMVETPRSMNMVSPTSNPTLNPAGTQPAVTAGNGCHNHMLSQTVPAANEIPRTLSMPPAYESRASTLPESPVHRPGSAILAGGFNNSSIDSFHQMLLTTPSQPAI